MKKVYVTTSWDDGHKLDLRLAELLKKYNIKGTFYISPDNLEIAEKDRVSDSEIVRLSEDFEIGAHTMRHRRLTSLPDGEAAAEIDNSKKYLEKLINKKVKTFCYPGGAYKKKHVKMVKESGFEYARTVRRHSFGSGDSFLEASTTVNAYNHIQDIWKIALFANFNLFKIIKYFQWNELAKAMFDHMLEEGGRYHLWGHSWEINKHNDWEKLEDVLRHITGRKNVHYVTNGESVTPRRKKLLIITPYYLPYLGGVQLYVHNIARRMKRDFKWDVCITTSGERGVKIKEESNEGISIYRLPFWFKISNTPVNFLWPFMIRKIIKTEGADIINTHSPVPFMGDAAIMAAGNVPVVMTYHSGSLKKNKILIDFFIRLYEQFFLPYFLKRAEFIICSSDFVRFDFLSEFLSKSMTITPAVDTDFFKQNNIKTRGNTILFVGGLTRSERHKGLKVLIDSISILEKQITDIQLIVVGDGNLKSYYEFYAKQHNLQNKICFKGKLFGQDLLNAYRESDLLILPSLGPAESFGMVLIEAMALGKPVIGTNVGGIPRVIDHERNGLLVAPNDSLDLAMAIKRILNDKEFAKRLGRSGMEKVILQFNWDTKAVKYNKVLNEIIKKKSTIVQISGYYPPHLGGMERVVKETSEGLARKGYKVCVLTTDRGFGDEKPELSANLSIYAMKSFELAHTPFAPSFILNLMRIPSKSLMHLHLSQAYYPEFVWLVSKLRQIPYIVHFHLDVEPSGKLGPFFSIYKKIVWGPVLRSALKIIVCSLDQANLVQSKYKVEANKVSVIPNAVSRDFFSKRNFLYPTNTFRLLYVGRLSPQKKVDRLIKMMRFLKIPATLTIIGDGESRKELELQAKESKLNNITFVGRKNDIQMQEYHRKSDIFLISSDKEGGTPLVVLEAMAASLPIVGTNVSGIRELVKGVGILVNEPFEKGFASVINSLWNTPMKLKELSFASFKKAEQYSWTKYAARIEKLYKKVLL